jgi:hypothetical protein
MTLKSSDALKVKEAVQTDGLPQRRARHLSDEARIMLDKSIVARRLRAPSAEEIRIKNTGMYYRWVAWKVLGGRRYGQMKAMGFQNATNADAEAMCPGITVTLDEITIGDLILMKLPYELWAAHFKANATRAEALGNKRSRGMYVENASPDIYSDAVPNRKNVSTEPFNRGGMETFQPSDAEIEGKLGKA